MQHERLRAVVGALDREIRRLPDEALTNESRATVRALLDSWGELVKLLALGPAPELRECPECGNIGMRAATLCGYCWSRLAPLPPLAHVSNGGGSQ